MQYDKVAGVLLREMGGIPLACGLAVAPDGKIWVGHEHTKVSVYSPDGVRLGTPLTDLIDVRALALQGDRLAVADRSGKLLLYEKSGIALNLVEGFGQPAGPGDKASNRLAQINGMAMDSEGNLIVSDRMGAGSRLQKITTALGQAWQQMGLEFSSQAAYGRENPDRLISSYRNIYEIDRTTGEWQFLGPGSTDIPGSYFGNFESTHFGPPRVVRFGDEDFFYYPAGDSMAVYRLMAAVDSEQGPTLKLVSVLGGSMPSPDGMHRAEWWRDENKYLWSWDDQESDGQIQFTSIAQPDEVILDASPNQPPGWKWDKASFGVDDSGWLWLASYARLMPPGPFEAKAIYAIPPGGLNALGNPIYRWAHAVKVMDEETGRQAIGMEPGQEFNWQMVNRSDDGMVYSLAYAAKPELPQDGARWMGGNMLFGFEGQTGAEPEPLGAPKWQVVLPERAVGMTPIPGGPGGVFVGILPATRATIGYSTRDGLLVRSFQADGAFGDDKPPNLASGALDAFLALNCNRDPRDGILDDRERRDGHVSLSALSGSQ